METQVQPLKNIQIYLDTAASIPSFFVSERIVKSLEKEEISFSQLIEMPIAEIQAKALQGTTPPRYFVLGAEPRISLN